jgi:hypothetical protein
MTALYRVYAKAVDGQANQGCSDCYNLAGRVCTVGLYSAWGQPLSEGGGHVTVLVHALEACHLTCDRALDYLRYYLLPFIWQVRSRGCAVYTGGRLAQPRFSQRESICIYSRARPPTPSFSP